jgi:hypothetical protein
MSLTTSYDVDRHLAAKAVKHYQHLKAAAAETGNKTEYRRCIDLIDMLSTQFGFCGSDK